MKRRAHRAAIIGIVASMLAPGCAVSGLSFVQDTRVKITAPKQNATVTLPFTVAWTAEDFDGSFLVFFDRAPMRPGQDLLSLVPDGDQCRAEPVCPDAEWLADRDIYVTDATTLEVDGLADRRDNDRSKDRHDVTIVYLDDDARRSGEAAFTKEFIVDRED